ncbi:hypothetical protein Sliba_41470 [Streptomyces nigrescens]|uniref:Uncharacterized protein n=1 Tax=Streptomyces nigrescens TaxID=1920 RepID=A0A640TKG7_STRNI|nr:hypothetical protein Sliba_41470 [Streptomyces libani subsp. libani]GGV93749.1 hypothetical protein GCM10010500_30150 [Streptomyces libani subsp. libani]
MGHEGAPRRTGRALPAIRALLNPHAPGAQPPRPSHHALPTTLLPTGPVTIARPR